MRKKPADRKVRAEGGGGGGPGTGAEIHSLVVCGEGVVGQAVPLKPTEEIMAEQ